MVNTVTNRCVLQISGYVYFLVLQAGLCFLQLVITQDLATGHYIMRDESTIHPHMSFH